MKKIVINGKFMGERMQGIVRYAREIVTALDQTMEDEEITLLLPPGIKNDLQLQNIRCVTYGKHKGMLWEQLDFALYLRKHKDALCVNLCNIAPLFAKPGVTVIHDIMYRVNPSHYTTFRNRLSRYWHILQYKMIAKRETQIITVSEFSKSEMMKWYPTTKGKINVVANGWQHVLGYQENIQWKKRYPFLKEGEFYFSLSTLSKNKNGKWIIEVAKNNPNAVFAIGGKYYETEKYITPENVHMLGFISDEDACALMKHCRAFIHPSLYEGFGIPPLEALALGAEVIVSNATSLPEVLGTSAIYINPYDYDVNIDSLLKQSTDNSALDRYSWVKSAEKLRSLLNEY